MQLFAILATGGIGLLVSLWANHLLIQLAKNSAGLHRPHDLHHGHTQAIPRIGGIALAAGFLAAALVATLVFPEELFLNSAAWSIGIGSLCMFALGLWDDLSPLGARRKLLGQVLISAAVCVSGLTVERIHVPLMGGDLELGFFGSFSLTVLWLVALTNLINLIDGVDGLAGGIALMLMLLLSYVGYGQGVHLLCVGMAGALIGFLRYNFPPARIYMGDGGAYMLGFLVGVTTIVSSQKGTVIAALVAPLFVLALPILDTALAIVRRGLQGLPVFRPDRRHIHHRVLGMGWSRRRTVLSIYCFCLVFMVLGFVIFWSRGQWLPIATGVGALVILITAGKLSFSREWFAVGRIIGNSLQMRGEIQYALAQIRWLELEGRRCESVEELWTDLTFIARKLGFKAARLQLEDGERLWQTDCQCRHLQSATHKLQQGRLGTLELRACLRASTEADGAKLPTEVVCAAPGPVVADAEVFEILSEIVAEGWMKAARAWIKERGLADVALRFDPESSPVQTAAQSNPLPLASAPQAARRPSA
ncbi:MAG: undecaprenyl/decaprenyl-phosphate alpha-N-acetylglucosaminyl 1-phosphate transferase [Verrucomicrobia bacterium]|nr:MAG: undecaprenyl/decaprenyl-phosphate alpha-N-acetylglucosaminyl 1-phosphate transferase [Verrucomicrobiota bacterium]